MIAYLKKYAVYISYIIIFLCCASIGHIQKSTDERAFMKGIAVSCVTTLFFTFYTCCYFLCHWSFENIHDCQGVDSNNELKPICKENGPNMNDNDTRRNFFSQNVIQWYYTYSFSFGVFCASFSIDMSNVIASFFFCLGGVISSCINFFKDEYDKEDHLRTRNKKNGGAILFLMVSMWCLYFFSFSFWFYNYKDFLFTPNENISISLNNTTSIRIESRMQWRYFWIEIFGPLMAPFWINSFKCKHVSDGYIFLSMPLLAFISMLFLTLYLTLERNASFMDFDTSIDKHLVEYIFVNLLLAPIAVFTSLIVYIGACGKRENYIICTSSQSMVFFIYSYVNYPIENGDRDGILPCCVMSFLCFMISILLLIIRVYYKEIAVENSCPSQCEEPMDQES